MSSSSRWSTRKSAVLSLTAGTIFLLATIFNSDGSWRFALSLSAGVLWMTIGILQLRNASGGPANPPLNDGSPIG